LSRIKVLRRPCYESLLSETDPSHDVLEARVVAQAIPLPVRLSDSQPPYTISAAGNTITAREKSRQEFCR